MCPDCSVVEPRMKARHTDLEHLMLRNYRIEVTAFVSDELAQGSFHSPDSTLKFFCAHNLQSGPLIVGCPCPGHTTGTDPTPAQPTGILSPMKEKDEQVSQRLVQVDRIRLDV